MKKAEAAKLEGTWELLGVEVGGRQGPSVRLLRGLTFRDGHRVAMNYDDGGSRSATGAPHEDHLDDENPFRQEDDRWNTFFLNPSKTEKEMTIVGKNLLVQAIYRLEGDTLTICYFARSEADRPTSFESKDDDVLPRAVWTFRRAVAEPKEHH